MAVVLDGKFLIKTDVLTILGSMTKDEKKETEELWQRRRFLLDEFNYLPKEIIITPEYHTLLANDIRNLTKKIRDIALRQYHNNSDLQQRVHSYRDYLESKLESRRQ